MSDRTEFLHPDFEPGEFDRIERELRRSLTQESSRMRPTDRLDTILHEAHRAGPVTATGGVGLRRWLVPAAAAAVVAAIAGGVWLSNQDQSATPGPPAGSPSASLPGPSVTGPSATDQPTTAPTQTSSPTTSPNDGPGAPVAMPVYLVGPIGDAAQTFKLFRTFIPTTLFVLADDSEKATKALTLAMDGSSTKDGYKNLWAGTTVTAATVTTDSIEIRLSGPGGYTIVGGGQPRGPYMTPELRRLAVQQLVWTAQAAVGRGNLPVRFEIEGGQTKLFGSISTDQSFTRPPADESWKDLAPIWVTAPTRGQVLPSGRSVRLQGEASVFEATLSWELTQEGGAPVSQGQAMASIGAPGRGQYSVDLGRLPAGSYSVKVFSTSQKDGSVAAQDAVTFTVK